MDKVSDTQGFEIQRMCRADFHGADYNPRKITESQRRKLKRSLEKNKLVTPITVNKRTMNVVGGHQRLSCIDSIEKNKNYYLDVAVIDVDEAEEKRINVALNNQSAMGDWDIEKLGELVSETDDFESMGFDDSDVFKLFGDSMAESQSAEKLLSIGEKIRQARDLYKSISTKNANKNDLEYYCVLVFRSQDQRDEFLSLAEMPPGRYQSGEDFMKLLEES